MKARRSKFAGDPEGWDSANVAPTLTTHDNGSEGRVTMLVTSPVVAFSPDQQHLQANTSSFPTLRASSKSGAAILSGGRVRRISPEECEALQGWPVGYTAFGLDRWGRRQQILDTPRYKMIGNGVAAPCAEWVARQIQKVHGAPAEALPSVGAPPFDVAFPEAIVRPPVRRGGDLPEHPDWTLRSVFFDNERRKWRAKYRMHGKVTIKTFTDEDSARTWLWAEAERHGAPSLVSMGHAAP